MNDVYLCLGGNIGNCTSTFGEAKRLISTQIGQIKKSSATYKTQAWGMDKAPDFYNEAILISSSLSPQNLINELLNIEKQLGRERNHQTNSYQNRIIDLDILFFNNEVIKTETLEIPHPRMHLRNFVLVPLQEIAPDFMHPVLNETITRLAETCPDTNQIKKHET